MYTSLVSHTRFLGLQYMQFGSWEGKGLWICSIWIFRMPAWKKGMLIPLGGVGGSDEREARLENPLLLTELCGLDVPSYYQFNPAACCFIRL